MCLRWRRRNPRPTRTALAWLDDDPDCGFLIQGLHDPAGGTGIARAVLSDSYRVVDKLDVLMARLEGVRTAGVGVGVGVAGCDLIERRMYVKERAPLVAEYASELLADYRSPFTGARCADNPPVFAGFVVSNSETVHGSFSLASPPLDGSGVGFQNSATPTDLRFQAACSYLLISPPRIGRRLICG